MPGRIMQSLKGRTSKPVFVLDEIDKLVAVKVILRQLLLEVLDPEQNTIL
jgi:ATP-dependent Lon protease